MFSTQDPKSPPAQRTQRACDQCRQRKARCDGLGMTDRKCSGCVSTGRECTYTNFKRKTLKPPRKVTPEYVEELEKTIIRMRELLVTVKPEVDVLSELGPSAESDSVTLTHFSKDYLTACLRNIDHASTPPLSDDDEDTYVPIEGRKGIVFGMSSSAHLAKEVVTMKNQSAASDYGIGTEDLPGLEPEIWMPSTAMHESFGDADLPDKNTLFKLTKVYFERVNIFWPYLHQPTIERQIAEGTYLTESIVGAKLMVLIAIASQYADDYQLYWNATDPKSSLAWRWFYIAQRLRRSTMISIPAVTLDELQFDSLMSRFLGAHQLGHAGWVLCGVALRMIQCAGAQKRTRYIQTPPLESEFTKRAVWTLMNVDVLWSAALGRTPMHMVTDIGPAIECDDEFCSDGNTTEESFKQPPDQPSKVSFLNRMISLMQILSFVLNTVYSSRYLKSHLSSNLPEFNQHLVRELDSAMNKWMDAMPAHLKWDPNAEDYAFFSQSAVLHCIFYLVQILIHRPFIPSSNKTSMIQLPSLSICLNAARACCRIADTYVKRMGFATPDIQFTVFTSALIILTSIYSKKKSSTSINVDKELAEVKRCIAILESSGDRWPSSSHKTQVLKDLASIAPDSAHTSSPSLSSSRTTPPNQSAFELNVDGLLSQTWDNPMAWDSLFSNLNGNYPDLGSQYHFDTVSPHANDINLAPNLPYESLWQNTAMSPINGMGDIFAGLQPMDGLFTDPPQKQDTEYPPHLTL